MEKKSGLFSKIFVTLFLTTMLLFTAGCQSKEEPKADRTANSTSQVEEKKATTEAKKVEIPSKRETKIFSSVVLAEKPENAPVVLFAHGFKGDRNGVGMFEQVAGPLAKKGISSIMIDFPGNGESEESYAAYTVANMQDDIESALTYMYETYKVDKAKTGLVGHSMGGRMSIVYAANHEIPTLVLWAPAAGSKLTGLEEFMGGEEVVAALYEEASKNGEVDYDLWGDPVVPLSKEFFSENESIDPIQMISTYKGELMLGVAANDTLISKDTTDKVFLSSGNTKLLTRIVVENATHIFTAADKSDNAKVSGELISETINFITRSFEN